WMAPERAVDAFLLNDQDAVVPDEIPQAYHRVSKRWMAPERAVDAFLLNDQDAVVPDEIPQAYHRVS
ncbi:hypothetical protein V5H38_23435, partial [Salmonella enterica]